MLKLSPEARAPWLDACRAQCRSFLAIPAISGVLRPSQWTRAPPIRLSWVLSAKPSTGEAKARIVMLGQHMREGVHFNDTHAPVASVTCVRALLAVTAASARLLTQFDVKAAFLTAPLDIELDVILPDGFGVGADDAQYSSPTGRRRRALTAIPGCPQGSRVWRDKLVQVLASLGFHTFLPDEPCLFKDSGADPIFLFSWVDDFVSSSPATPSGRQRESSLKEGLRRCFPHAGTKVYHLLGCVLERPTLDVIRLHQGPYIKQILRRAGCQDGPGNPKQVPVSPTMRLTKADCLERAPGDRDHAWYRSGHVSEPCAELDSAGSSLPDFEGR